VSRENDLAAEIEKAEAELASLGQAREQAIVRLTALRAAGSKTGSQPQLRLPIAAATVAPRSGVEKVRLFRSLFRGRTDVFPKRWENAKQARSGYSPACANEWVRGVCDKPKVKCSQEDSLRAPTGCEPYQFLWPVRRSRRAVRPRDSPVILELSHLRTPIFEMSAFAAALVFTVNYQL
jgi:hypothetical protein